MRKKYPQKNNQGFTLIEALVAVFIFSSAVVFLITMAGRGLLALNASEKQTTAYFLAQEGIEIVHNFRDEAFLNASPWLGGINPICIGSNVDCGFDIDSNNQTTSGIPCSGNACIIKMDNNTPSKFSYSGPNQTPFTRRIQLQEQDLDGDNINDALEVTSIVSWQQGTFTRNVVLTEVLREWIVSANAPAPLSGPSSLSPSNSTPAQTQSTGNSIVNP
ncbi:MAG: prepilin-type N-terminal cleavage/methylation domain-containing protein [Candidatus Pacebacteria bacterium]|nr:prepilin-type N-terminal cleavage/methylation domain-containing protein [Candidatus Paceibacterota bacterium]